MEQEKQVWLCFFRGVNAFGKGTIPMSELQYKCSTTFKKLGVNLFFLDYYDSKGNIGVLSDGVPVEDIQNTLFQAIGKTCAIVRPDVVKQVNLALRDLDIPPSVFGQERTWSCL